MSVPIIKDAVERARRAEAAGWHGITFTDSQNLCPDPFVVFAGVAAGTEHIQLATGVTNVHTRHPAALATAAATVNEIAGGRFVLGTGRGDTALFHLGLPPMPIAQFFERTARLQTYLAGGTIDIDGRESRIRWLDSAKAGKVPLDIAASGPKVIDFSARTAERITFALGADPVRVAWGIDLARAAAADAGRDPADLTFGSYVSIGCHPDLDAARAMVHGSVAAFAHFSSMPGSTGAGLAEQDRGIVAEVGRRYDSNQHLRNDAKHNAVLTGEFIDRFAITGPPDRVVDRLHELAALGIDRFVVTGPGFGADRDAVRTSTELLTTEVLPAVDLTQPTRRWRCRVNSALHRHHSRPAPPGDGDVGPIAHYIAIASGRASRESLRFGEMTARNGDRPAIRMDGLTKRFGSVVALNDLTLDVAEGEVFGFLGPNGAGKSTTLRLLLGLIKPTAGRAEIKGIDVARTTEVHAHLPTCPVTSASGRASPVKSASNCSPDCRAASTRPTAANSSNGSNSTSRSGPGPTPRATGRRSPSWPHSRGGPTCCCSTNRRAASTR